MASNHSETFMRDLINNVEDVTLSDADSGDSQLEELPLTVLFKFIRPFNGDRRELSSFLQNGNSAFSLASQTQKAPLLLYVVSQLSINVVNEVELSEVKTWKELKSKLRLYYSHTKHLVHAHEELEMIRQHSNESITDFFKRVERAKNDCLQAEILNNHESSKEDLPGLKRSIQQTALRRFIIHCHPSISTMLRAREIKSLNEAFSLALREEKILNYTKGRQVKEMYCSFCHKNNHTSENCKRKQQNALSVSRKDVSQNNATNSRFYTSNAPRYSQAPQGAFPQRSQPAAFSRGNDNAQYNRFNQRNGDHPQYNRFSRPNGDNPHYRSTNDHPRRPYNNERTGPNQNFGNPRVNNVQSEDLNGNALMSDAPSEDQTVQEAFRTMCIM